MKWQKVKLGDVCEISSGGTPSRANYAYWQKGTIPWVKISDMNGRYIDKTEEMITQQGVDNSSAKLYKKGTLLYSIFASIGEVGILNIDATCNQAIAGLEPKYNICKNYVYYVLKALKHLVCKKGRGVAQNNINLSILKNIEIPLPPKEEQERIAQELDAVADLLVKQKQLLTEQDTLIKSVFYDMFGKYFEIGNTYKLLPDICKFIDYRGKTPEKADSGILLITAKNVRPNLFQSEPQEYISEDTYDARMTRGFPQINDVMFTTEAPLGYVCRIPRLNGKFSVGQRIIVMHPYSEITSEYLEYALSSDSFQSEMYKHSSGSTARGIRSAELEKLSIPVPPLPLQQKFADIVEQIEAQKQKIKSAITETETLFNALMAKYFDEE